MYELKISRKDTSLLLIKSRFYELIAAIANEIFNKDNAFVKPDAFECAKNFLESRYNQHISIQALCDMLSISSSHLNRLFKQSMNKSPMQYLMELKVCAAKKYLSEGTLTLSEISEAVGFSDKSYFSRLFKTRFGLTPGEFREKCSTQMVKMLLESDSAPAYNQYVVSNSKLNSIASNTYVNAVKITNLDIETIYMAVPQRIITLSGPAAELCIALGVSEKIIAASFAEGSPEMCFEEYIQDIKAIPVLDGGKKSSGIPDFDSLLRYKPDLVIGTSYSFRSFSGIADAECFIAEGINIYASRGTYLPNCTMDDVYQDISDIGRILNAEKKAAEIIAKMRIKLELIMETVRSTQRPYRVFVYDAGEQRAYTAGMSLESVLISIAGGINVFGGISGQFIFVEWEDIRLADPEYIIIHDYGNNDGANKKKAFLKQRLPEVSAVKNNHFIVINLDMIFPGIQNADAAELIAKEMYPNKFIE